MEIYLTGILLFFFFVVSSRYKATLSIKYSLQLLYFKVFSLFNQTLFISNSGNRMLLFEIDCCVDMYKSNFGRVVHHSYKYLKFRLASVVIFFRAPICHCVANPWNFTSFSIILICTRIDVFQSLKSIEKYLQAKFPRRLKLVFRFLTSN